jgi:ABC-type sugar transport system permease subunit
VLVVMGVFPFIYVLVISFFDWNAFAADPTMRFAGLENYRRLVVRYEYDPRRFLAFAQLACLHKVLKRLKPL